MEEAEADARVGVVQPLILEQSVTHDNTLHVWWQPLTLTHTLTHDEPQLLTRFDNARTLLQKSEAQVAFSLLAIFPRHAPALPLIT